MEKRHHCAVLPKDVYNLKQKLKGSSTDASDCDVLLRQIVDDGGFVEYAKDDKNNFMYVVFQTKQMIDVLQKFPEVLILDFTYKTNKYLLPLLTVMAVDGEGHGLPVLHAFVKKEDTEFIAKCLTALSSKYDTGLTCCFMVDKDFAEMSALELMFPDVPINICHFHINQAVSRFLRKELASDAYPKVLETFMAQVYTESTEEYNSLKDDITNSVPQKVADYFQRNWWDKSKFWATSENRSVLKLKATTTNHLESFHAKIKKYLNVHISLASAIENLTMFDNGQITTSLRSAVIRANSVCYRSSTMQDDTVNTVLNTLTRFAADLVIQQLTLSRTVNYAITVANSEYIVSYKEKQHSATPTVCECSFHKQMKLPCRHILFIRQQLGLPVFDASLVHGRFCQDLASTHQSQNFSSALSTVFVSSANTKTAEGRYRKATALFSDMASYLSVLSEQEFLEKVTFLECLFSTWHEPTATTSTDTSQPTAATSTDTSQPTATTSTDTSQPTAATSTDTSQLTATTSTDNAQPTSSSRMRVIYHNWSATKQRPHPQSVAEISHHSVLSGDRIRQCETSSGSRHKDTDQCL